MHFCLQFPPFLSYFFTLPFWISFLLMDSPLFFDIDGTLIHSDGEMSERTVKALTDAHRKGHAIALCSGRCVDGLTKITSRLPFKPFLCTLNGAYIESDDGTVVHSSAFERRDIEKLVMMIKESGLDYMFFTGCHWGTEGMNFLHRLEFSITGAEGRVGDVLEIAKDEEVNKLLAYGLHEDGERFLRVSKEAFPTFNIGFSSPTYVEVNTPNTDKGLAVRKVCAYIGAEVGDAYCFGDYDNDIPMFTLGAHSVAMANSSESVKRVATAFCPSNDDDGVAVYIENNLL